MPAAGGRGLKHVQSLTARAELSIAPGLSTRNAEGMIVSVSAAISAIVTNWGWRGDVRSALGRRDCGGGGELRLGEDVAHRVESHGS